MRMGGMRPPDGCLSDGGRAEAIRLGSRDARAIGQFFADRLNGESSWVRTSDLLIKSYRHGRSDMFRIMP